MAEVSKPFKPLYALDNSNVACFKRVFNFEVDFFFVVADVFNFVWFSFALIQFDAPIHIAEHMIAYILYPCDLFANYLAC